jgi:Ni/Fe-hydrogenase subunit HybB-like protein
MMMVHTSLELGFTSKQNGNLLSIIHAVSACYLFLVLVGIPRIMERRKRADFSASRDRTSTLNAVLALLSFVTQIITLSCFGNASQPWQVYIISAISALGLATPSFIKSHFLGYFPKEKSGKAMAALSMMEALGALISPLILGAWQTLNPGNRVFYGAAGMIAMAGILFGCSALILAKRDLILSASEGI